eukprot:4848953-Pyramimonas_sp.AAC.1
MTEGFHPSLLGHGFGIADYALAAVFPQCRQRIIQASGLSNTVQQILLAVSYLQMGPVRRSGTGPKRLELDGGSLSWMMIAVLPTLVYSDFKGLIEGLTWGPDWCRHPPRPNVDLWDLIWTKIDDLGGLSDSLEVRHARGHQRGMD